MEFEKKKKLEEEKHRKLGEEEKKRLKELHFMRCPKCGMELIEIYYNGVHTGKCSECGGIWLDEGEFEMLSKSDKSISQWIVQYVQKIMGGPRRHSNRN